MATKVAINGFGRIGRLALRAIVETNRSDLQVVALKPEPTAELRVGHGLDVEDEAIHRVAHDFFIRTAKAITSPASSVRLT